MRPLALAIGVVIGLGWAVALLHGASSRGSVRACPGRAACAVDRRAADRSRRRDSRPASRIRRGRLPRAAAAGLTDGDSVELRFRDALDGAKVEAVAEGPRLHATLLHKRVGGDTVAVPLAPGRVDAVELRVRRHFRAPPIVRDAVVFAPGYGASSASTARSVSPIGALITSVAMPIQRRRIAVDDHQRRAGVRRRLGQQVRGRDQPATSPSTMNSRARSRRLPGRARASPRAAPRRTARRPGRACRRRRRRSAGRLQELGGRSLGAAAIAADVRERAVKLEHARRRRRGCESRRHFA